METDNPRPITNPVSSFNPLTHIPPKYDIYGRLKKQYNYGGTQYNILAEKDKIKIPWQNDLSQSQSTPMTRTKLIERRKKERIPDISYDLDKDGYVGGKDYVLAKRFDVDNDGKLNEKEKQAAYEGIKQGIEENYIWNLDNQGGRRAFRIMQKRGKVIDAEDFLPLRDTYPVHPLSKIEPRNGIKTLKELEEYRKNQTKNEINQKLKEWDIKNPPHFVNEPINVSSNKPLYQSVEEIRNKMHREARLKAGLSENETDIKVTNKDPTLAYIYNPKHRTAKDIQIDFHKENLEESKKLNSLKHKNEVERLNEREDEIFAKLYKSENGMTFTKLQEQRKKEIFDYNLKHFSQHAIGVHGQELPKFSENEKMKEFWKLKDGYVDKPTFQSQVDLLENHKFWKKPEELLLSEHKDEIPKPDKFKRETVLPETKDDLIIRVNQVNFYKDFDPSKVRPVDIEKASKNHIYRWTTLVTQFAPQKFKKGRFFDSIEQPVVEEDNNPLKDWKPNSVIKQKEEKVVEEKAKVEELNVVPKMPLYQKFSNKEDVKLTKSMIVRSKAF